MLNIRWFVVRIVAPAIAACGLLAVPSSPHDILAADADFQSAIAGKVVDHDGRAIAGATVKIAYAWMRIGSSPYCPSCWADCSKTATSDSAGHFEIKSVDRRLVFRVLCICKGYEPKMADVDPQEHKLPKITLKSRPATPKDPRQIVCGQVVDSKGKPVAGALVEPFGGKDGEKRWFGGGRWTGVDSLAVTDNSGRFEILSAHPADSFDLKISARALVTKKFAVVPTGKADNRLIMTEGAAVRGRVVDHGRPVAGISVGMIHADRRGIENAISPLEIGTDAHGEFLFANVPPNRDLNIYGIMDSLRDRGCTSVRRIHVGADGSETDVGDLLVEPAYRISGRIVLSDGKPVPAHTRVNIGREHAWDSQIVDADASGAFMARRIPPELVTLHAPVDGYRMSDKNVSFEPLNAAFLEGVVRKDIDGLLVLLEPGKRTRVDRESRTQEYWRKLSLTEKRVKVEPLVGAVPMPGGYRNVEESIVERPLLESKPRPKPLPKITLPPPLPKPVSADANVPKRSIVGRVVDPARKPISGALVSYRVRRDAALGEFVVHGKSGSDGRFKLEFPIEWLPTNATAADVGLFAVVYAPGYCTGFGNAMPQAIPDWARLNPDWPERKDLPTNPLEIQLSRPSDAEFTVLAPDDKPLAGARVVLPSIVSPSQSFAEAGAITDEHGRVRIRGVPPDNKSDRIVNATVKAAGYGSQDFLLFGPHERSYTLKLAPVGRIEGQIVASQRELFRGMRVSITTEAKMAPTDREEKVRCTGSAELQVDADGRFVAREIPAGRIRLDAEIADRRLPVRPRLIEDEQVEVVPGRTTHIEIPLEMVAKVHGLIRAKETGKPVAGAEVIVQSNNFSLQETATTDVNGRYTAAILPGGDVNLQIIGAQAQGFQQSHDSQEARYAVPEDATDFELPVLEVEKCKDVTGLLLDKDGKPADRVIVYAYSGKKRYGFVVAWDEGKFTFRNVPASTIFDSFHVGNYKRGVHDEPVTIQSQNPLVLRLR